MSSTGQQLVAGRVPGERIATATATSDTTTTAATEVAYDSVTASVVSGRTYRVRFVAGFSSDAATTGAYVRIREGTTTAGTQLGYQQAYAPNTTATFPITVEVEWTASSTGSQSFCVTLARASGAGNVRFRGAATQPRYLYVDYIQG